MKKILFLLLSTSLFIACNQGPEKSKTETLDSHSSEPTSELA